ncbi:hypothetical protein FQN50_003067 [Emmonsiellopsis sp. PD_5]|nr:hypothetical protein FQN50_003067 [Emmonsiellopsis sp. PD_5]
MEFDHLAEKNQEMKFTVWLKFFLGKSPEILSMELALKHRPGKPLAACRWKNGAFNICYRVKYEDGFHAIVRFAALGKAILRREKVEHEVATMNYLRRNTSIPVPEVLGSGICLTGPYIVMPFIEGDPLSQLLKAHKEGRPVLNPQLSDRSLKKAYQEMAMLILELSKPEFHAIGALEENEGKFTVARRPLTFNMNELMASANLPEEAFPSRTFKSAADYFDELAQLQLSHLRLQRNDAISCEEDCRKKFTARCLFRRVVKDIFRGDRQGPFRLYCDDFRPSNVLFDPKKLRVSGVIDWEFTYAAPAEFTYVAPWWLLLQSPEDWESDLSQFLIRYTPRFRLFLEALKESEERLIQQHNLLESQRLSTQMEHSMETGLFWICLAARYSSMFDEIYWAFIDRQYYGPFTSFDDRIRLLDQEEQREMGELTMLKISQSNEDFKDCYPVDKLFEL